MSNLQATPSHRRNLALAATLGLAAWGLPGCSSITSFEQPDLPVTINADTPPSTNAAAGSEPASPVYSMDAYNNDLGQYNSAIAKKDLDTAKIYRDKMTYAIMADIDYNYGQYKGHVHLGRSGIQLAGDVASLGISAATTVAGGSALKSILGAAGTAIQGTNQAYSNDFYAQKATEVLVSAMDSAHTTKETEIINNLKTQTAEEYPFGLARVELIELFYCSTREAGLCQLEQKAATDASTANNNKADVTSSPNGVPTSTSTITTSTTTTTKPKKTAAKKES